jgi:hypothetical protein
MMRCWSTPFTVKTRLALLALLPLVAASCGGGVMGTLTGGQGDWPGHGWDGGARQGSYVAVAVDQSERELDPLTASLALAVAPTADGERVTISARELRGLDHAFLHLKYDERAVHPVSTSCGERISEGVVFLGITSQPGVVVLGLSTVHSLPTLRGDMDLTAVDFAAGPFTGMRRAMAVADTAVSDLRFSTANPETLLWTYASPGDYDQNSEVNISDLTPIGTYFKATSSSTNWAAARVADGDPNGEVNLGDIQPIAVHYLRRVTDYQVKSGSAVSGPFADVTDGLVPHGSSIIPAGGGFRLFSKALTAAVDNAWYVVSAVDGAEEASGHSNAVQYIPGGALLPPQNLTAHSDGTNIILNWDPPSGATPDSYSAFLSDQSDMTGAVQLNSSPITVLTFTVPVLFPPTNSYYFAVSAVYASQSSPYSNICHYVPGGNAPQNLVATRVGTPSDHIELTWEAPASGSPTGYDAYVGSDDTMAGEIKLNGGGPISGLTFSVQALIGPDQEHYFGVKAKYPEGDSGYSNIYHYVPGGGPDTTPPHWLGDDGILTATPDDGVVSITWSAAQDDDTPPVVYLVAYCEDGQNFDWGTADLYTAGITDATFTPLTNGQRYKFAVRAEDSVTPTPNVTTNTNFLTATPQVLPTSPSDIPPSGGLSASDVASVRMPGEEVPRIVCVNHSDNLYYAYWDAAALPPVWVTMDLNTVVPGMPAGRKYHPQMLAIGDDVHLLLTTSAGIYELSGPKDSPETWQKQTVTTNIGGSFGCTGTGFAYSPAGDYFAAVWATNFGGEKVFYADRDSGGGWGASSIAMDGNPQIWQCDMAIRESDGAQWVVAANGSADSTADNLKFYYATRSDRYGTWTGGNTTYGGDVMVVEIDPLSDQPVVLDAEVETIDVGYGQLVPVTHSSVFLYDGSSWLRTQVELATASFDGTNLYFTYTGQDPQLVFTPLGKAVGIWSKLDFDVDLLEDLWQLSGGTHRSLRSGATWGAPFAETPYICSSNSVTAGESFFHGVTCQLGMIDEGDSTYMSGKYSQRNDYAEGALYYFRKPWPSS